MNKMLIITSLSLTTVFSLLLYNLLAITNQILIHLLDLLPLVFALKKVCYHPILTSLHLYDFLFSLTLRFAHEVLQFNQK